jgi:hypothetical protein
LISAAPASASAAFRLVMAMVAPWSTKASAIARPMPFVEPVMNANFPVRSKSDPDIYSSIVLFRRPLIGEILFWPRVMTAPRGESHPA